MNNRVAAVDRVKILMIRCTARGNLHPWRMGTTTHSHLRCKLMSSKVNCNRFYLIHESQAIPLTQIETRQQNWHKFEWTIIRIRLSLTLLWKNPKQEFSVGSILSVCRKRLKNASNTMDENYERFLFFFFPQSPRLTTHHQTFTFVIRTRSNNYTTTGILLNLFSQPFEHERTIIFVICKRTTKGSVRAKMKVGEREWWLLRKSRVLRITIDRRLEIYLDGRKVLLYRWQRCEYERRWD